MPSQTSEKKFFASRDFTCRSGAFEKNSQISLKENKFYCAVGTDTNYAKSLAGQILKSSSIQRPTLETSTQPLMRQLRTPLLRRDGQIFTASLTRRASSFMALGSMTSFLTLLLRDAHSPSLTSQYAIAFKILTPNNGDIFLADDVHDASYSAGSTP